MSTYAATQVGAYLKERFQFSFTDEPILQRLEDHIWEAGRRAQTQRKAVAVACQALNDDVRYVLASTGNLDRAPYVPNDHGNLSATVAQCVELEREVQDLVGVHQAVLWALRAHLSTLPTLEEHSNALGELRGVRAERDQARHEVTELLAAREQWEADEVSAQRRLDDVTAERDSLAEQLGSNRG